MKITKIKKTKSKVTLIFENEKLEILFNGKSDVNLEVGQSIISDKMEVIDTGLNSSGRMKQFMEAFGIKAPMQNHSETTPYFIEDLKQLGRYHHILAHKLIDTDGKVYHMDYARFFPTEIQLNINDKSSTPKLANLQNFTITKALINQKEYFEDYQIMYVTRRENEKVISDRSISREKNDNKLLRENRYVLEEFINSDYIDFIMFIEAKKYDLKLIRRIIRIAEKNNDEILIRFNNKLEELDSINLEESNRVVNIIRKSLDNNIKFDSIDYYSTTNLPASLLLRYKSAGLDNRTRKLIFSFEPKLKFDVYKNPKKLFKLKASDIMIL